MLARLSCRFSRAAPSARRRGASVPLAAAEEEEKGGRGICSCTRTRSSWNKKLRLLHAVACHTPLSCAIAAIVPHTPTQVLFGRRPPGRDLHARELVSAAHRRPRPREAAREGAPVSGEGQVPGLDPAVALEVLLLLDERSELRLLVLDHLGRRVARPDALARRADEGAARLAQELERAADVEDLPMGGVGGAREGGVRVRVRRGFRRRGEGTKGRTGRRRRPRSGRTTRQSGQCAAARP